jgi:autotransporter-associated beta strand protein/T5SS/PEP-CTERM-associated repeat protein
MTAGSIVTGGTCRIGERVGASGSALIQGGQWQSGPIYVGGQGTGNLEIRGGLASGPEVFVGGFAGALVMAGGTLNASVTIGTGGGPASLAVTGGLLLSDHGVVGASGTAAAIATVSNGSWTTASLVVGANGNGIVNLTDGGRLAIQSGTGTLVLGASAGSSGSLNLGTGGVAGELAAAVVSCSLGAAFVNINNSEIYTFNPQIAGSIAISKTGTGRAILNAANTYTGSTIVSGGILSLGTNGSISSSTNLVLSPGGVFDTTPKASGSYKIPAGQKLTVGLKQSGSNGAGRLDALALDISGAAVEFSFSAQPNEPVYVVANYTSLTGTASVSNLPPRYSLDYAYNNGTQIALVSQNHPPVANADSAFAHLPVTIPVTANDSDPDGDPLFVSAVTQGQHGTVTISGSQSVTYSPGPSFGTADSDSFTYTVADGFGGFAVGTVSITKVNQPPVANDDTAVTSGSAVKIAVLANDTDPDGDSLQVSSVTQGASGTVTFDAHSVTYTPGSLLLDHFTYTIADGFGGSATASVTVKSSVPVETDSLQAGLKGGGSPVAGEPAGTTYARFGVPAINDPGATAFWALLRTGSGFVRALLTGTEARVMVRQGDPAPDALGIPIPGAFFASFADPAINREGKVAFIATLSGKSVPGSAKTGLWTDAFGPLSLVARVGQPAPGMSGGARLGAITSTLLAEGNGNGDNGTVFFTGRLSPGRGGVTGSSDFALWSVNGSGASVLLREGDSLLVDGTTMKLKLLATLGVVKGSPGQGRFARQDSVVVQAFFTNGLDAVLLLAPGQAPEVVALEGESLPGAPAGALAKTFGPPTLTGNGLVGGRIRFLPGTGGITVSNLEAIVVGGSAGDYSQLLARQSDPAPGLPGKQNSKIVFRQLGEPVINAQGYSAFTGVFSGPGIKGANNTGLWWGKPGALQLIARKGDAAPGTKGRFASFTSLALPDDASVGEIIGPVFAATISGSKTTGGLWALNSAGILQLVVQKGSLKTVNGKAQAITDITVLPAVAGSPAQARSYNGERQLIYRLSFRDGSQQIVKALIP